MLRQRQSTRLLGVLEPDSNKISMKKLLTILSFLTLLIPLVVYAQLTDNFDSYSTGNLTGQGSWSGSSSFQVENSVSQTSPNAVADSDQSSNITKSFTLHSSGTQIYWGRATDVTTANLWTVKLTDAGSNVTDTRTNNGNVEYYASGGFHTLGAVSANTWWQINVKWDAATGFCQYSINGGTYTTAATCLGTIVHGIDGVNFDDVGGPSGTVYFDSFSDGVPAAPATFLGFWRPF